ncbi:DNA helicase RecQ [Paenibacillus sp. J31TS4]|uniref:DNA helicase RecQ n=1 Tax=Paenibacillus sp. J31TS4 TaxID=2807195 RepID=UPI001B1851E0|nr:DNA helicase RecQ [Paenibacillus sp. J31TS4]GIP38402.1 DNA helicase RecQ [Paenibacillus sp. J31TS4]
MIEQAKQVLKQAFGYDSFKKGQEELIGAILSGRDALGVMPTGAGKSVCYQLPAAVLPGVTLVVSPLISLMKDQVDALNQAGIPATFLNSTLSAQEAGERHRDILEGRYKMVYVAPERLESDRFLRLLEEIQVPFVAVDEAHCVSQWGHDFRPSYRLIRRLRDHIHPRPVMAAFTATATDKVKQDIITQLDLDDPYRVTTGYARDNLAFSVVKGATKRDFLADYIRKNREHAGIVYASTRKEVEDCQRFLAGLGLRAGKYHAGMSDDERMRMQDLFLFDELDVMVATNAFGMGIDKSNVRYVIHNNLPKNLESYYQEAGRAGRDGEPGECILLFSPQDIVTQKFLIEQGDQDEERRRIDYGNLNGMIEYAHTTECLQRFIVRYFGDPDSEPCGRCSNCTDEREAVDLTVEAQKVFSCIVRMKQRFGVTLTAKVLRGASDARVRQFGFDALPTYGALNNYKEKDIVNMINIMVADGYLSLSDSQYPVVSLTAKAKEVLQGTEKVMQRLPAAAGSLTRVIDSRTEALFERLRGLRKEWAERQKVPPFTIFHDATLREIAELQPQTMDALLVVKGVGQAKAEKYGDAFVSAVRTFLEENPAEEGDGGTARMRSAGEAGGGSRAAAGRASSRTDADGRASHEVSFALWEGGMEAGEIAKERGMSLVTIQDHILRCATEGRELDWGRLIPDGQEPLILEAAQELGTAKLRPLKDALPPEVDYFAIKAVLAKHEL